MPILQTGCKLTAVEYGEQFSKLCIEEFKDYPNFSVITNKFENVDFEEQARLRAKIAEKYGFIDVRYALFSRTRTFSAKKYITLLGTYSDHIAIEEMVRKEFFSKIAQAIDSHGGKITVYDTIDLQLARKTC